MLLVSYKDNLQLFVSYNMYRSYPSYTHSEKMHFNIYGVTSSSSSGAELPLIAERFGLLNELFPFPLILNVDDPDFNIHLTNILVDVILPTVLGSSL
jgi:hypothetical protein